MPGGGATLHVVKFDGGGFVVTSGDTLVSPIVAFSESGTELVQDDANPMWALLKADLAAREAAAGVVHGDAAPTAETADVAPETVLASTTATAAEKEWAALLADAEGGAGGAPHYKAKLAAQGVSSISDVRVAPLVQSKWSQSTSDNYYGSTSYCYNYYTPNHYVCGCVATMMSQIMRYHKYPTGSVTPKTYTCSVGGTAGSYTMQGGTYDWDNMPLVPRSGATEAQRQAIGKLTYDAGVTAFMAWSSGGSSASSAGAAIALPTDWGYSQALALVFQNGCSPYSLDSVKNVVIPNCDAGYPLGMGISGGGGHAVVVDGYGYSGGTFYMHINYGWAGSDDAWYNPPNLSTSSYTYNVIDDFEFNIFPDKTGTIVSGRVLDVSGSPLAGVSMSISGSTTGTTTTDSNGIYAFVVPIAAGTYTVTATSGGATATKDVTTKKMTSTRVVDGTYDGQTVRGLYYGTSVTLANSYDNDLTLAVSSETPPTISSATASSVTYTGATISVNLSALGDGSSSATVAVAVNGTTKTEAYTATGVKTFAFTGLAAGTAYTAMVTATGSNGKVATTTVAFTTATATPPSATLAISGVSFTTSTATVSNLAKGDETGTISLTLEVSTSSDFGTLAFTATGASPFAITGLDPATTYYARVRLVGATLSGVTATQTFTTSAYTAPTIASATAGSITATGATIVVNLSAFGDGSDSATVKVSLSGTEKSETYTATGSKNFVFTGLAAGTAYAATVTATGSNGKVATKTVSFTTAKAPKPAGEWFTVNLGAAPYTTWPASDPDGTWSGAVSGAALVGSVVTYSGDLLFTPDPASTAGSNVVVSGSIKVSPYDSLPTVPSGTIAGIAFLKNQSAIDSYVLANGAWALFGHGFAAPEEGSMLDWKAEFKLDESNKKVRYTLGTTAGAWLALSGVDHVTAVAFAGAGAFGSFRGRYATLAAVELPDKVTFTADGTGLAIDPATGTLSLTISDAVAGEGIYYTVFASETLGGTYKAVAASQTAPSDGILSFAGIKMDTASKFLKVVASAAPFAAGAVLP